MSKTYTKPTLRLLAEAAKTGATIASVAESLGLGVDHVRLRLRNLRVSLPAGRRPRPPLLAPFTAESLALAYRRFVAGDGLRQVAADFGVECSLMRRRFEANGYPVLGPAEAKLRRSAGVTRALTILGAEDVERAKVLNDAGYTSAQIGEALGVAGSTVYYSMRRRGMTPVRQWKKGTRYRQKLSDETYKAFWMRWQLGEYPEEMCKEVGLPGVTLRAAWKRLGLPSRSRRLPRRVAQ